MIFDGKPNPSFSGQRYANQGTSTCCLELLSSYWRLNYCPVVLKWIVIDPESSMSM
ncbi:unnamed protein product [Musa banksii]